MTTPNMSALPAVIQHLRNSHPHERNLDRISAVATFLVSKGLATVNPWGQVALDPGAKVVAPRCFPAPKIETDGEAAVHAFLKGNVIPAEEALPEMYGKRDPNGNIVPPARPAFVAKSLAEVKAMKSDRDRANYLDDAEEALAAKFRAAGRNPDDL